MKFNIIELIKQELDNEEGVNVKGKLSFTFINKLAYNSKAIYLHPTENMRICILQLESGHEVYGIAQVLDKANDVEDIGNKVAFDRARDEIWSVAGAIAKTLI